jgi:hypothetical protein
MAERLASVEEFSADRISKVSWLLSFLYRRYNKFADLGNEIEAGSGGLSGEAPVEEVDAGYKDLKKALEGIKSFVHEWNLNPEKLPFEGEAPESDS